MRYTQDMMEIMKLDRYAYAGEIFDSILKKEPPSLETLTKLHGSSDSASRVSDFINNRVYTIPEFSGGIIKRPDPDAPKILSDMVHLTDNDEDFCAMDEYFTLQINRKEDLKTLYKEIDSTLGKNFRNKFGPYASYAMNAAALAMYHHRTRKSGISVLDHWIGTAGIMHFLEATENIPKHSDPFFRITATFFHDFKEDFAGIVRHVDGRPYGINRIEEFGKEYIPGGEMFIHNTDIVTNLYSEITKEGFEIIKNHGELFTVDSFKDFINESVKQFQSDTSMYSALNNLYDFISRNNYKNNAGKDLMEIIRRESYNQYTKEIIRNSERLGIDTPIIIKTCDYAHNFIGKETLSDDNLIKILLKIKSWSSQLMSNPNTLPYIREFARELGEDVLDYCRYHVIRDIMRREQIIKNNGIAVQNIIKLQPIFYEKAV